MFVQFNPVTDGAEIRRGCWPMSLSRKGPPPTDHRMVDHEALLLYPCCKDGGVLIHHVKKTLKHVHRKGQLWWTQLTSRRRWHHVPEPDSAPVAYLVEPIIEVFEG